ncbi:hypothetical protein PUN28_000066 [Cardiocondyla obscurior]|uniref:Secreted protein n=1 Tax=Cardiocondyla obscurior TaxID=286306 RepID=A0AAW2GXY9_9HYME
MLVLIRLFAVLIGDLLIAPTAARSMTFRKKNTIRLQTVNSRENSTAYIACLRKYNTNPVYYPLVISSSTNEIYMSVFRKHVLIWTYGKPPL